MTDQEREAAKIMDKILDRLSTFAINLSQLARDINFPEDKTEILFYRIQTVLNIFEIGSTFLGTSVRVKPEHKHKVQEFREQYGSFVNYYQEKTRKEIQQKEDKELERTNVKESIKAAKNTRITAWIAIVLSVVALAVALFKK